MPIERDEWFDAEGNMDFEEVQEDLSFASDMIGMAQRHEGNKQRAETNKLLKEQALERKRIARLPDCPRCGGKIPKRGVEVCVHCGAELFWVNLAMNIKLDNERRVFVKGDKAKFTDAINALNIQEKIDKSLREISIGFQSLYKDALNQDTILAKSGASPQQRLDLLSQHNELSFKARQLNSEINKHQEHVENNLGCYWGCSTPIAIGVSFTIVWLLGLGDHHGLLGLGNLLKQQYGFSDASVGMVTLIALPVIFICTMVLLHKVISGTPTQDEELESHDSEVSTLESNPLVNSLLKVNKHLDLLEPISKRLSRINELLVRIRECLEHADLDRLKDAHLFAADYKTPRLALPYPHTHSYAASVLKAAESLNINIQGNSNNQSASNPASSQSKSQPTNTEAVPVAYWLKRGETIRGPLERVAILQAATGKKLLSGDQIANSKDGPWQNITKEQLQQMQQGNDVEIK